MSSKQLSFLRRPYFAKRILEIGGGHEPFAGVTHAVDKFPQDNRERAGTLVLGKGVVFKEGELEAIPFPDEPKFDFLYVSHVLEHVLSASKAVSEINRVAKLGYLETPSPLREQIFCPFPFDKAADFHTQFCWTAGEPNTIHVIRKSEKAVGDFCACANGKFAKLVFDLKRQKGIDTEPLLSNPAKTTYLFFKAPLRLMEHEDFESACRSGSCGFSSVRRMAWRLIAPFYLISSRSRKLKGLLAGS
ncbi:MAG TPA: methyltransferase domain-containing protein [bacterium]